MSDSSTNWAPSLNSIVPVALPLKPPIEPQLALSRKQIPDDDGWVYEPKYDGFRSIAFVDGDELFLQSRSGRPLARYFPELVFPKGSYVIDGELLILDEDGHEVFDALQNRLHPAESRVKMLSEATPALFRAFDLIAIGDHSALDDPFTERRAALEKLIESFDDPGSIELTPLVETAAEAEGWLAERGGGYRQEGSTRHTCAASARPWSRSSACGRSTRSSPAGAPARRRTRSDH